MSDSSEASQYSVPLGLGGQVIAAWGVLGFSAILVSAIYRLTPLAIQPIEAGSLSTLQVVVYALWVAWMAWAEGYRGFQQQLSPRVAARAVYLTRNRNPLHVALAPAFVMSLFHATRKRLIVSWVLFGGITALVIGVRQLDQPWRGIIDGGVVVGLTWGLVSILYSYVRAAVGVGPLVDPETPSVA